MTDERNDGGVDEKSGTERDRLVSMLHDLADRMAQARQERITESIDWVKDSVEAVKRAVDRALGRP